MTLDELASYYSDKHSMARKRKMLAVVPHVSSPIRFEVTNFRQTSDNQIELILKPIKGE